MRPGLVCALLVAWLTVWLDLALLCVFLAKAAEGAKNRAVHRHPTRGRCFRPGWREGVSKCMQAV